MIRQRIKQTSVIHGTPSGDCDIVTMELLGQEFMAISAGPYFKFTPAISFLVSCSTAAEVDSRWKTLSSGGQVLMELGEYPFSKRYGWLQDRYGLSWQLMLDSENKARQRITPSLLFVGGLCGKADEAIRFWTSVFRDARAGEIMRYGEGEEPDRSGTVKFASFTLEGQELAAMDSAHGHDFTFNEAVSLVVRCGDQAGSTTTGTDSPRSLTPSSADGSRTGTASPGRSCPWPWTRCSRPGTQRRWTASRRPFSR